MAESVTNLDTIQASQSQHDAVANELFNGTSWSLGFARQGKTTAALTWGFYGMRIAGTLVANGTVALTASTTNYVVAHRTTFAVTASTAITNWNDTTVYGRMYLIVTGTATVTSYQDWRYATGGILVGGGGGGTGTVTSVAATVPAEFAIAGSPITTSGTLAITKANQTANLVWAGPTSGGAAAPAFRALVALDLPVIKDTIILSVSDETTAITTGVSKVTFRMPYAMTLTAVRASLSTASSSGLPTIDINESGTTILSTKITIDASEKTSTTAATPPVISDSTLADDAEMTIDIDVAGTGATGLKVYLIGTRAAA